MTSWISGPFLLAALLVGGTWSAWQLNAGANRAEPPVENLPAPAHMFAYRGTASCASTACHGATGNPAGSKRGEYTTWMTHDKHVRAYEALLTERSRVIERNYRHLEDTKSAQPEKDALCLRCHSMDARAVLHGQETAFADGIGCERCHGPAEKWLTVHYLRDWKQKSAAEKELLGYHNTKDLHARVGVCIECHVGVGETQVDHDLNAAGHPRLNFEYGAYLATMPPHWSVAEERTRYPDLQGRVWAIGQTASAQAALELLAFRADEKNKKPWPEFAEYDCYACHRDLKAESRQQRKGDRVPGTLPWCDWYYAMPRTLADEGAALAGIDFREALAGIRTEMNKPLPDRAKVKEESRKAAQLLAPRLSALRQAKSLDAASLRQWFDKIEQAAPGDNWDSAAQRYLGLAALYNGMTDLDPRQRDESLRKKLKAMTIELRFPPRFDSPGQAAPRTTSD